MQGKTSLVKVCCISPPADSLGVAAGLLLLLVLAGSGAAQTCGQDAATDPVELSVAGAAVGVGWAFAVLVAVRTVDTGAAVAATAAALAAFFSALLSFAVSAAAGAAVARGCCWLVPFALSLSAMASRRCFSKAIIRGACAYSQSWPLGQVPS